MTSTVCHRDQTDEAFQALKEILINIGLPLNHRKVFPPCMKLDIMGICVDVKSRTFSIAPEKMGKIVRECISMFLRDTFTKRELQSLLGKLLYVSCCVSQSRRFLNRMLATLRDNHASRIIFPDENFQRDLLWFIQFLVPFNGVVTYRHSPVRYHVYVDATLTGLGAVWGTRVYAAGIPLAL